MTARKTRWKFTTEFRYEAACLVGVFIKPLGDPILGTDFMRVTTSLPEDNERVVQTLLDLF